VVALVRGRSETIARERLLLTLSSVAASYCEPFERALSRDQLRVLCGDIALPTCGVDGNALASQGRSTSSGIERGRRTILVTSRRRRIPENGTRIPAAVL
jgi:hypothetical protein